jgi:hypothetical protein
MRSIQPWIALGCWLFLATIFVWAETRKAGLWEITTTTTWQRSPSGPGATRGPAKGGPHTTQVLSDSRDDR